MPNQVTVVVNGVSVSIEDSASETSFPTNRATWPAAAHAPTVLGFKLGAKSFFDLSAGDRRTTFAQMAHALTGLGKGARAGNPATLVKDDAGRPVRSIAYGDSVAIGERAKLRARMLAADVGASSCAMFARGLLKMIGAKTASFANEYVDGSVFSELNATASLGTSVRGTPGKTEPWLRSDGTPFTDAKGQTIQRVRTPRIGDIVVVANDAWLHAHTFVITDDVGDPDDLASGVVERTDRDGVTRAFIKRWYTVAQGGQAAELPKYPDDGSCMGANERTHVLDPQGWVWDQYGGGGANRTVKYWIDVAELGAFCDTDVIVMPDRKMTW
jgi:hypothetical protein